MPLATTAGPANHASPSSNALGTITRSLGVGVVVFLAARLGIWSRSELDLAVFWPANALLLGLLVRHPARATPLGWLAAVAGFVIADLTTGNLPIRTAWLTAANLSGIVVGWVLLLRLTPEDRQLRTPPSVLRVFGICAVAALGAAIPGAACGVHYFDMGAVEGLQVWWSTELAMYLALLPVLLASPSLAELRLRFAAWVHLVRGRGWSAAPST